MAPRISSLLSRRALVGAISLAIAPCVFAGPAQVWIYPFEGSAPLQDVTIAIGAAPAAISGAAAAVGAALPAGTHEVVVRRQDAEVARFPIEIVDDEQVRIALALNPGVAPYYTVSSNLSGDKTVNLASLDATSARSLAALDGPRTPTATDAQTTDDVALQGIEVESQKLPTNDRAAYQEIERYSAQVEDSIAAEDIARAGDSDVAAALKRVTGLSQVDGKFVYVRGLGERYSSVLFNGAQIPSPDPTRRVVPLDLFPTEILDGIVVRKTYSSDMPGEFGGGTIQLDTRGVPSGFLLRASGTVGYSDGTTGEDGLRSRGDGHDWTGFDGGFRDAPDGLFVPPLPPRNSPALIDLGANLASKGFAIGRKEVGPDTGFGFSVGDDFGFGDSGVSLGFISAFRYAQNWDHREEDRAEFSILPDDSLVSQQDYRREQTERAIDSGAFISTGLKIGNDHEITATLMQVRQTLQQDRIDEGIKGAGSLERSFSSEWTENELTTRQLGGKHRFGEGRGLDLTWQYTDSDAGRDSPFARSYRYFDQPTLGGFIYDSSSAEIRYDTLADSVQEAQWGISYPFFWGDHDSLTLNAGGSLLDRERDSAIRRFGLRVRGTIPRVPLPIDDIINEGNVRDGTIELFSRGRSTDFYTAEQSLDALFLGADLVLGDWRAYLGVREEANEQEVVTLDPVSPEAVPVIGRIDRTDRLPTAALTWSYSDQAQLRFGYSETVSRPDFRELSLAPFTDPLLDISVIGNPNLRPVDITGYDVRWEYYFNGADSVSIALFRKDFVDPIELVRTPASGELLELRNADSAINQGIELDLYKGLGFVGDGDGWWSRFAPWQDLYLGANYSWIDSEVDLGGNVGTQTSAQRPLQGQSPYVANLSLSWQPGDGIEATLLYNVFGERISKVGESGVPDEYEQPFHQLDFTFSAELPWKGWRTKLRLRNLLDPAVEYHQGDETSRRYRKGREAALTLEWHF